MERSLLVHAREWSDFEEELFGGDWFLLVCTVLLTLLSYADMFVRMYVCMYVCRRR